MAIPEISRTDVLAAIERIRKEGVPPARQLRKYSVVHDGRHYPPKYVVSLAVENATGQALDAQEFNGGVETNSCLGQLGFSMVTFSREAADTGQLSATPLEEKGLTRVAEEVTVFSKLPHRTALIGRVVVRGQACAPAVGEAMLLDILEHRWPDGLHLKFLITPGGFVVAPFPLSLPGGISWSSTPADLDGLILHAEPALSQTVTERVLRAAEGKVDVVTIGIDLKGYCPEHAELVATYELSSRRVFWTGKSYPTSSQERNLVQVVDLNTHLLELAGERVLVLGCHDLNMFSPRGWKNQLPDGVRRQRCEQMRKFARRFAPTIVLQHPHSTDTPNIWRTPWAGLRRELPGVKAWASGIGYHNWGKPCRAPLRRVLEATQGGPSCKDFIVETPVGALSRRFKKMMER